MRATWCENETSLAKVMSLDGLKWIYMAVSWQLIVMKIFPFYSKIWITTVGLLSDQW